MNGNVESSCDPFEDKVQCCMLYSVRKFDFRHSLHEQKAQPTREGAKSGKRSTMSNDGPLDLFDSLDSGTAFFLLKNIRIIVCVILYRKSSEDNEGTNSILFETIFELTTAISRKSKKTEGKSEIYSDDLLHR